MTTHSSKLEFRLDTIESVFERLAQSADLLISTTSRSLPTITRRRWDGPNISLRWPDKAMKIQKSVEVTLVDPDRARIDAAAWLDVDNPDGSRTRKYKTYRRTDVREGELPQAIPEVFEMARSWNKHDLKTAAQLASNDTA